MDGALLPGVRIDIVLALNMRGDLVLLVWTTLWVDDPGIVPPGSQGTTETRKDPGMISIHSAAIIWSGCHPSSALSVASRAPM